MILGEAEWVFRKLSVGPRNSKSDTIAYYNTETSGEDEGRYSNDNFLWETIGLFFLLRKPMDQVLGKSEGED